MKTNALLCILDEVLKGYTESKYNKKTIYVKHFSLMDQASFEKEYSYHFERARSRDIHTEEAKLQYCIEKKLWSEEQEKEIAILKRTISSLSDSRKKIILPSQLEATETRIKNEESKLAKIQGDRRETLGFTCEVFASQKMNNYSVYKAFYTDKNLSIPLFDQDEFDDMSPAELSILSMRYTSLTKKFDLDNIKRISVSNYFQNYYYLCEERATDFMGKPVIDFTVYQVRLLNYAKYFKILISQTENIPEEVSVDPDRLIDHLEAQKSRDRVIGKNKNDNVGVMGATKEDLKTLSSEYKVDDTHVAMQKSGKKSLSMRDLLDLQQKDK